MPKSKMVMMLVAVCAVGMLTGCGVPKEEHEAKLAELNAAWEEIETLKGEKAGLEESLQAEQKQLRKLRQEAEDAVKVAEALKTKEAADAETIATAENKISRLESALAAVQSAKTVADGTISELEAAVADLKAENAQLINRFNQLKKNMLAVDGGMAVPGESAPAADDSGKKSGKSAMDLLDEMSRQ